MKTRLLVVLLVFGFLFGNVPITQAETGEWTTEAPPLSDLVSHWDGHIRLLSYDLGPSPTPPPPGEKAACDPQLYAAVVAAFEEIKALGSIPSELNISSTGPDAGIMELSVHYSLKGAFSSTSSKPTSIPFHYQDGSLSAQLEESGLQENLSAWATRTTKFSLGLVVSSSISIAGNLKLIDPKTGKVIAYYTLVFAQEGGFDVPRGELLGYNLNLLDATQEGKVEFLPFDGKEWQPITMEGFPLHAGDRLRTKDPYGVVHLLLTDGAFAIYGTRIAHGTISFGKVGVAPTAKSFAKSFKIMIESIPAMAVSVTTGLVMAIWSISTNPPPVEIRTHGMSNGVLGTAVVIEEAENGTTVKVLEGHVQSIAFGNGASQVLAAGQSITGNEQGLSEVAPFDMAAELAKWGPMEVNATPSSSSATPLPSSATPLPSSATPLPSSATTPPISPSASVQPSSELPTGVSPSATAPPTPQPTGSGTFLGLATQWWIVIGAGLGLLLLALLVMVLIVRSGRRQRRIPPAYSAPPIPGPAAIHCRACGTTLPPGQRFCGSCGADSLMVAVPPVSPPVVPAGNVCPTCGHPVIPGDRFCQGCGGALPGGPS